MIDYDPNYNPAAPVVAVRLLNPATGKAVDLSALVDTGAGVSAVSLEIANELGLEPIGTMRVRGFDTIRRTVPVFRSTWIIEGHLLLGIECVAIKGRGALVGRDVLQHFILTVNGKAGTFTLVDP